MNHHDEKKQPPVSMVTNSLPALINSGSCASFAGGSAKANRPFSEGKNTSPQDGDNCTKHFLDQIKIK